MYQNKIYTVLVVVHPRPLVVKKYVLSLNYIYIYIYVCVCVYIYIYIYMNLCI